MDPAAFDFSLFNWVGFVLAIVANMVIGFVWYAPWFPTGKVWLRDQGMDPSNMPKMKGAQMAVPMVLMVIGATLMMFVFAHTNGVYLDAFRNTASGGRAGYHLSVMDGIMGGFFTWLGFVVPLNLNAVAFDRKPWSTFFVNAGYYLVALLVAGILIVTVGAK
ncbi:MAG TPA: DUF1761 domain-containing protein [Candidatus Thermoplasmatota archaeon]|nr:DUF1761 domain-containing protein [Candidatus Thermoplasmatota archaeon]